MTQELQKTHGMWTSNFMGIGLRVAVAITVMIALSLPLKCQDKKEEAEVEVEVIVRGLMFRSLLPLAVYEGRVVQYNKTLYLYERGDDIVMQYPVENQRSGITANQDGDIISDELEELFTSYKYILYRRGDSLGLHYDSLNDMNPLPLPVDSLLISHGMFTSRKLLRRIKDSVSLVSSEWDSNKIILREKYIPAPGTKRRISDTIVLTYSRQLDEYSFSLPGSELLSTGMKISRLQLITDPVVNSTEEIERHRREMLFEISASVTYVDDIKYLLKEFHLLKRATQ